MRLAVLSSWKNLDASHRTSRTLVTLFAFCFQLAQYITNAVAEHGEQTSRRYASLFQSGVTTLLGWYQKFLTSILLSIIDSRRTIRNAGCCDKVETAVSDCLQMPLVGHLYWLRQKGKTSMWSISILVTCELSMYHYWIMKREETDLWATTFVFWCIRNRSSIQYREVPCSCLTNCGLLQVLNGTRCTISTNDETLQSFLTISDVMDKLMRWRLPMSQLQF